MQSSTGHTNANGEFLVTWNLIYLMSQSSFQAQGRINSLSRNVNHKNKKTKSFHQLRELCNLEWFSFNRRVTGFVTPSLTFYKSNISIGVANPDRYEGFDMSGYATLTRLQITSPLNPLPAAAPAQRVSRWIPQGLQCLPLPCLRSWWRRGCSRP